jgi:hypothetical protein
MNIIHQSKIKTFYLCADCNYRTEIKQHFNRHFDTIKHVSTVRNNKSTINQKHVCDCGKTYTYRSGLCKHKKKCKYDDIDDNNYEYEIIDDLKYNEFKYNELKCESKNESNADDKNQMILTLIRQNDEFKQMLVDQNKRIMEMVQDREKETGIIYNNSNTTNHFNLQVFLNVTCKDAMNMSDFLNSLQLQVEDLEDTGKYGYVDGISKIFINKLNELNINDRPMYCTDLRREIIYIKDNNVWEKETQEKKKLKCIIKTITHNNIKQILVWQKNNPGWDDPRSQINDKYLQIVSNNMSGISEEEEQRNYDRIISKVAQKILIPKANYIKN